MALVNAFDRASLSASPGCPLLPATGVLCRPPPLDRNHDGVITRSEFAAALGAPAVAPVTAVAAPAPSVGVTARVQSVVPAVTMAAPVVEYVAPAAQHLQ
eukprot:2642730-Amphidinium_carterae.2